MDLTMTDLPSRIDEAMDMARRYGQIEVYARILAMIEEHEVRWSVSGIEMEADMARAAKHLAWHIEQIRDGKE